MAPQAADGKPQPTRRDEFCVLRTITTDIPKFEELNGYAEKAIARKIETGAWREGREYRRAPDAHIFVDLQGYERWVENQPPAA